MTTSRTTQKVQRWIDLLTTLLSHNFPLTFLDLARGVPQYLADGSVDRGEPSPTLKRMFERDKLELRSMGVPIETIGEEGEEDTSYRLRPGDFYLPYLAVASQRGTLKPKKVDRHGYRSLAELTFDADELVAVAEGAARARQLGDPVLRADVDAAVRKLAVDLPLGAASAGDATYVRQPRSSGDPATFEALSDALFRQKRVTFDYRSMGRDETARRAAEPYGLFFINGHWYLVGHDTERDALRNFRVSRMGAVKVNAAREGTPDYSIPEGFSLREHARSRNAWELGDDQPLEAIVEVRGTSGAARAAAELGEPVEGNPDRRCYEVRRRDVFARWLLSFAGELVPVAPPALVEEFRAQVAATRARYVSGARA
ncbi:MAG: WYL domain-containing protein [Gemmatimonadaceae bacterium]|nr:WYL domain-containing protein [Gemmatimonadaceae bacterium]NUR18901.1 WYL domain-containing protein [Gemmatimonadaceae bacterium]NUS97181.1 WYL domain-containing protein [Gemmatimonadaceae bacterium]